MEQVRIVKEMREADKRNGRTGDMVRPRYLVWENVVGAFSSNKGKDFAAVLEEIIKIVEPEAPSIEVPEKGWPTWGGYHDEVGGRWSVVWRTHDAQYWGVPQRRRRISVVADFGGDTASEIQFDRKSVSGDIAESGASGEGPAEAAERGFNPAVARSLTARADGSPCADRGPNIVCSPHQGGCDGGGKGTLVQTEKSGTLGTGNDQTIFAPTPITLMVATRCKALGRGTGFGIGEPGDPANTISAAHSHGVFATAIPINDKATRWQGGGESRNHDGSGNGLGVGKEGDPSPTLTAGDRHGVMCAGFKLGNSEQARSIGYQEELSPTLNAECGGNKPAVVALDMTHACDVIRECGEQAPSLQARMGTGGNQVPLTYQDVTGTLSPGAHAGSYNGQDAYNDMLVCGATPDVAHALRAKANCAYREDAETYPVQHMVARRLTPMECERLQGFPDGWTDIGDWVKTDKRGREIKVKGSADSPRYKALGNSIALPFWDWMLRRMARYLTEGATLGSLFDGIAGFPLIWERIHGKGTARWASEIEPFPIAVTKRWFGED
nr:MAG TPA: Cytosine specific methyltransferase [Caudoviricetes sp.]